MSARRAGAWLVACAACVPSGEVPVLAVETCDRFDLVGELAVDRTTGLTWTRFVETEVVTNEVAAARCADRGMRLPTRAELEDLVDEDAEGCRLPCGFHGVRCATLLCGSSVPGSEDHWGVTFAAAALVRVEAAEAQAFVCVR